MTEPITIRVNGYTLQELEEKLGPIGTGLTITAISYEPDIWCDKSELQEKISKLAAELAAKDQIIRDLSEVIGNAKMEAEKQAEKHAGTLCEYQKLRRELQPRTAGNNPEGVRLPERQRLMKAVSAACSCGGGGPRDKHTCPACMVWHLMEIERGENG